MQISGTSVVSTPKPDFEKEKAQESSNFVNVANSRIDAFLDSKPIVIIDEYVLDNVGILYDIAGTINDIAKEFTKVADWVDKALLSSKFFIPFTLCLVIPKLFKKIINISKSKSVADGVRRAAMAVFKATKVAKAFKKMID